MSLTKQLIVTGLFVGMLNSGPGHCADWESGPLFHEFDLTLEGGRRWEAAGPLVSYERRPDITQWAFSPLLSHSRDTGADVEELDLAYPLLTYDRFGTEYRLQLLQLFSFSGGQNQQETPKNESPSFPSISSSALPTPT